MAKDGEKTYEVDGILFTNEQEAKQAERELEGITHIKKQNNMEDSKVVLVLYNKLKEKNLFITPVGTAFLEELKIQLIASPAIDNKKIVGYDPEEEKRKEQEELAEKLRRRDEQNQLIKTVEQVYKYRFYNSLILNFVLVAAIIFMLYVTLNSKNVNILNYENRLIEKYMTWEQDLNTRESELNEREKSEN